MATFGEIVYSVLDLLKERSDDAYYTEEHVLFLAKNMRNFLLERKYKNSRNGAYSAMSDENKQQLCLNVTLADLLPEGCGGFALRSDEKIPQLLTVSTGVACTVHDTVQTQVTFVPIERLPYVGYNKWLRNFIYAARSADGHLYLTSSNPQFAHLGRVGLTGVFADFEAAAYLTHAVCMAGENCPDLYDLPFPLESALVPSCIELVVKELLGSRYAPEDKANNAKDDLGDASAASARANAPVESEEQEQ